MTTTKSTWQIGLTYKLIDKELFKYVLLHRGYDTMDVDYLFEYHFMSTNELYVSWGEFGTLSSGMLYCGETGLSFTLDDLKFFEKVDMCEGMTLICAIHKFENFWEFCKGVEEEKFKYYKKISNQHEELGCFDLNISDFIDGVYLVEE